MFHIYSMSNQRNRTFRLSFIRRRIITLCQIRALRAALLAELNGGPDAALVVEMVEWARLPTRHPTQVVTPMPQQNGEEARAEEPNFSCAASESTKAREARSSHPCRNPTSGRGHRLCGELSCHCSDYSGQ